MFNQLILNNYSNNNRNLTITEPTRYTYKIEIN